MSTSQIRIADGLTKRARHRHLTERIIITGHLVLTSPAHFGNGDAEAFTDMPVFLDEVDGQPLITGASLAGALRNYLREWQWGYELKLPTRDPLAPDHEDWLETERDLLATALFGGHHGDPNGAQSPLIVEDALGEHPAVLELRDGVALDAKTRTALDKKKFDYELLSAGTQFRLRFELLLDEDDEKDDHAEAKRKKTALAIALTALAKGEIHLGARKRRGFGRCRVSQWTVTNYKLNEPHDLFAWLAADYPDWPLAHRPIPKPSNEIAALLDIELQEIADVDRREAFDVEASFTIDGALMVRSGFGAQGPDTIHLHTYSIDSQQSKPVLPGTGVAGALRQRALRIINTLAGDNEVAQQNVQQFIDKMFGPSEIKSGDQARASRVLVTENFIQGGHTLVQTRIKIDRFTGGTIESALLEEAPHFGGEVTLRFCLRNSDNAEVGLLLLVLKDLWLGDLQVGGEAGIGRGRLRGKSVKLNRNGENPFAMMMEAKGSDGEVTFSDESALTTLETCIAALHQIDWTKE